VTPVQERSRQRIDAILDATAGLLAGQGTEGVSMLAIAEAAGIPPATVYHYFENRLAVFAALARRTMAEVDAALTALLADFAAPDSLDAGVLLTRLYAAYRDAPGYVAVLRALGAEPALQELVRESNQRVAAVLGSVLAQRTRLPRARADRVAWILSEACEQVVQAALMAGPAEARALIAEMAEMVDALLRHYGTRA
jgi:AcrR family transcriptional regulator